MSRKSTIVLAAIITLCFVGCRQPSVLTDDSLHENYHDYLYDIYGDINIYYSEYEEVKTIDIGITASFEEPKRKIVFTPSELDSLLKMQVKDKLVCVTLCKNLWSKDKITDVINSLNDYLFKCGASRVKIFQGYSSCQLLLSDKFRSY